MKIEEPATLNRAWKGIGMGTRWHGLSGRLRGFGQREDGLVTVEWLAVAGAVVFGGITVVWLTMNGLENSGQNIGNTVASCHAVPAQLRGQAMADCVHAQNGSQGQGGRGP